MSRAYAPVALLVGSYVAWNLYLCWKMYYGYGYPPFDLAIFDQGLWLLSHLHAPFVTIMGRNLFGDHASLILLLVAPFYRLVPEPQGILVLQTLSLAAASAPIFVLAKKMTHSTMIATVLVGVYLLNPALQQGNLEQFHPEALQVLIISVAIYAAVESRGALLGVMVVLALLVKEDAAALVVPLGLWVLIRRDRRWGLSIIAGAVAWALVANLAIIPTLLGTNSFYASRIPFGGLWGVLRTVASSPIQFISYLRSSTRLFYVWQMGFSTGWIFLLAPEIAAIALLALVENVISLDPYMHQILYHYSMPLVPVLVIGTAFAIGAQKSERRRNVATAIVVVSALVSSILWGLAPFSRTTVYPTWSPDSATTAAIGTMERSIPSTAVVVAWYPLVTHLDHRSGIYVWPNPFYAENWGLGTNTGARLASASDVQYLMLPDPLNVTENPDVFRWIARAFRLMHRADGIGLYRRITP